MIRIRKAEDRGAADHGWLDTKYTFSFSDYQDPEQMAFRALRVMNEDRVAAGAGFPMHGHRDMEIITVVLDGELAHKDSMGNGETLHPGEVQHMTAGTGIRHSEFNPSPDRPVHLYQVWLLPDRAGHTPGYDQRRFDPEGHAVRLQVVASPDGRDGSIAIHQDASLYLLDLDDGQEVDHPLSPGRHGWVQVLRGTANLNGQALATGDGAALSGEPAIKLQGQGRGEMLVFDLA